MFEEPLQSTLPIGIKMNNFNIINLIITQVTILVECSNYIVPSLYVSTIIYESTLADPLK